MSLTQSPYSRLITELKEIALLGSVSALLDWDERTQLPPKGAENRAAQASLLARMIHERVTAKRIGDLLGEAGAGAEADSDAAVNIRETRRRYDRACKVPASLVEEQTRVAVLAQQAWGEARAKNDYPAFRPWLEKILDLKRQEADCVGYAAERYDALLDEFEPGETAANVRQTFEQLRQALVPLLGKIVDSGRKAPLEILERRYPPETQAALARRAAEAVGFDFEAGRLDVSLHPFCTGLGAGDTRMTTRYDANYFGDAFFGVLHETGHGLYDQGLPKEHEGTPLAEATSLGIHESQSRMWENFVGRSRSFWAHFLPMTREAFPEALRGVTDDQWYFAVNDIRPSLIRTEADEATYNLHVLLRFELEQALLDDQLKPADLPEAWNQKMRQYMGIVPPDDARGCLQDIHWSSGAIGYFPTYTLGNLYAAQFFEKASAELGDIDAQFAGGDFAPLLAWLGKNIHRHGKRYRARELVQRITGEGLSSAPLMRHLERKAKLYVD
ncbi:MAG TPA: carboxypeptidase M32 [Tepidisphaeraceae bacterium]